MSRPPRDDDELLPGEWACLGVLAEGPSHGFAVAGRLAPSGDIGRVWSCSRPLTYRAIDQLVERGFVESVGSEPGTAGGSRTILRPTRRGRAALRRWLVEPSMHLRDLRYELLLKLVLSRANGIDPTDLIREQRRVVRKIRHGLESALAENPDDLVVRWRLRSAEAATRFLDDLN
jgi:PadR family transcriptional regulator AphA